MSEPAVPVSSSVHKAAVEADFFGLPLPDDLFRLYDALAKLNPAAPCGDGLSFCAFPLSRACNPHFE